MTQKNTITSLNEIDIYMIASFVHNYEKGIVTGRSKLTYTAVGSAKYGQLIAK